MLSGLLGHNVTSVKRIGGGRNSQVYRVACGRSGIYAAKRYFRHSSDDRDRLQVEFSSLQFLWQNGVRCVPRPLAMDRENDCAVYEYIDGKQISFPEVTASDIDYCVQFLGMLNQLKTAEGSRSLPPAAEACFSVSAIVENIRVRLNKLTSLGTRGTQYEALHDFLTNDFVPSFDEVTQWCKSNLSQSGTSFDSDLEDEERTLSPSDFGFHNALRRGDGQIVFLDFDYFGWDDPAKMVSDFLLHPAMELGEELKRRFVSKILSRFQNHRFLDKRIESVYPLFGLKWCLILLNEFVPEYLLRRRFARGGSINKDNLLAEQLVKARRMLARVMSEYENFPYRY